MRFTMRSRLARFLPGLVSDGISVTERLPSVARLDSRGRLSLHGLWRSHCSSFNPALKQLALENPFYVNAGSMHHVGIELSDLDQVLHFSNRDFRSSRHHGIEISCRLAIDQISPGITLPGLH